MIPFIVGAITGALAVRTVQRTSVRDKLPAIAVGRVKEGLRDATLAGLNSIEHSSARLRQRIERPAPVESDAVTPDVTPAPVAPSSDEPQA